MTKTVHGKTIELAEDLGVPEGQAVEIQVTMLETGQRPSPPPSEGLAKIYSILGERYNTGQTDTAARHDEHERSRSAL